MGAPEIGVKRKNDESDEDYARRAVGVEHVRTEPVPAHSDKSLTSARSDERSARRPLPPALSRANFD